MQEHIPPEQVARALAMKKVGLKMSILMGVTLSFFLSLLGTLGSGHFAVIPWLISFVASTIVSLIIGFFVPMKKVTDNLHQKLSLDPKKLGTHCFDTLISDCIYTPIITLLMVFLSYRSATAHGAQLRFAPMFLHSLVVSMIAGYILIFICMPLFMKLVLPKDMGPRQ